MEEVRSPEPDNFIIGFTRDFSGFLREMIISISDGAKRIELLGEIVNTPFSLAVSHDILLYFLDEAGIWQNGIFQPDKSDSQEQANQAFVIPREQLYILKDEWLALVRKVASQRDILETEPNPIAILYRWGQLNNNDYTEVKAYIAKCMKNKTWLARFVEFFYHNQSQMPPFLPEGCIDEIDNLPDNKHAQELVEVWKKLEEEKNSQSTGT